METDVLIVGSGIAGLSCALQLVESDPFVKVLVLDKSQNQESNSQYAQGGIAAVLDHNKDSFFEHFKDTILAGRGMNNEEIVVTMVLSAPIIIEKLQQWGVDFDKDENGSFVQGLEGGHSKARIVHYKDKTGLKIQEKLHERAIQHPRIQILKGLFALDLLLGDDKTEGLQPECKGVLAYDLLRNQHISIWAKTVVLATGGTGQLFKRTTNSAIATGDGLAMAVRAGALVQDLDYYQFHPTAIFTAHDKKALLITEALRGAGAFIVNHKEERFLKESHEDGELANRDVVTALIYSELKKSKKSHVFIDARHLDTEFLKVTFPQVVENCATLGLDISKELIPIIPAAHYQCGGITVDEKGQSSIKSLFAIGECAHTGLHGANRLASNSLLEAMVLALECSSEILSKMDNHQDLNAVKSSVYQEIKTFSDEEDNGNILQIRQDLENEITGFMIGKDHLDQNPDDLLLKIDFWKKLIHLQFIRGERSLHLLELRNLLEVAKIMVINYQSKNVNVKHY